MQKGIHEAIITEKEWNVARAKRERTGHRVTMEIYVEGRVEYGIGYDDSIQYIRVKNLTPEKYAILQKYKTDRPLEDFAPIAFLK